MSRTLHQLRVSTNCRACTSKCCSQPYDWVYLTDREVDRIARRTGLQPSEFSLEQENPHGGATLRMLMLPCQFLSPEHGTCNIYEDRPLVCRLFPFYPEAMTGTVALLPAQCGDNLTVHSPESNAGWGLVDFEDTIDTWLHELWADSFSRYRSAHSTETGSKTIADGSP
jgi:Fe-S-cluster containining protein